MTAEEYIDKFMQLETLADLAYKNGDEEAMADLKNQMDVLKRQMFDDLTDLEFMDVCWTMASIIEEEE